MKRRVWWGLGGTVLLVLLGLAALLYFAVLRPAESVMADLDLMADLESMNDGVWIRGSYTPPAGGNLSREQLSRFSRVQSSMRIGLGPEYSLLDERAEKLKGLTTTSGGDREPKRLGIREAILAFRGLGPSLKRAKELQVNALNTEQFSVDEYRWVRGAFYRALGFSRAGVYFEDFAASLRDRKRVDLEVEETAPPPTEQNRELAAAYADSVDSWFPFLVFGF